MVTDVSTEYCPGTLAVQNIFEEEVTQMETALRGWKLKTIISLPVIVAVAISVNTAAFAAGWDK
jgi:hypothetical protein